MMRLLSMATPSYFELRDITWPAKVDYANKWGLEAIHETHSEPYDLWERAELWKKNIIGSGWMFFCACDVAITNTNFDIHSFIDDSTDLVVAIDGNGVNIDVFLVRECDATIDMFNKVWDYKGKLIHEQDAIVHVLSTNPPEWRHNIRSFQNGQRPGWWPTNELLEIARDEFNQSDVRVKIVPQRQLNAYPMKVYGYSGREWWSWQPGDFCCHMVAMSLADRVRCLGQIIKEYGQ